MSRDALALLTAMGVRVREVDDLGEPGIWLPNRQILLLDSGLDDAVQTALANKATARLDEVYRTVEVVDLGDLASVETPADIHW